MYSSKPLFIRDKIQFFRDENNGKKLLVLKEFPELHEIIINKTTYEILTLSDGHNTIDEIVDHLYNKYNVNKQVLIRDVSTCLSKYSKIGIIKWVGDNDPFILINRVLTESGYNIRLASENDYKLIYDYISNQKSQQNIHFLTTTNPKYDELNLRMRIFYRTEDFYILVDKDNLIKCMLGIQNNYAASINMPVCSFMSFSDDCNAEDIEFVIKYLLDTYNDNAIVKANKIRIVMPYNISENIVSYFLNCNFTKEADLMHEQGVNKHATLYAYYYL